MTDHSSGAEVHLQLARPVDGRHDAGPGPPQQRPHSRQQFFYAEWLGEVVVGTQVQRAHLVTLTGSGRQHQHRHWYLHLAAYGGQHAQAVWTGQPDVQNEQIEGSFSDQRQRFGTVHSYKHVIAAGFQIQPHVLAHGCLVVNDENRRAGSAHGILRGRRSFKRQSHHQARTTRLPVLRPDASAVGLDDSSTDGESQACAWYARLLNTSGPVELVEDVLQVVRRDARTGVFDRQLELTAEARR